MNFVTISFDDENSSSMELNQKNVPRPPMKANQALGVQNPGARRPMPKRINKISTENSNQAKSSEIKSGLNTKSSGFSNPTTRSNPSHITSNQPQTRKFQNKPLLQKKNTNKDNDYEYSEYEYDDYSYNEYSNSIVPKKTKPEINSTAIKPQRSSNIPNQPRRQIRSQNIQMNQISKAQSKQQLEIHSSSDSYYEYSESEPKNTPTPLPAQVPRQNIERNHHKSTNQNVKQNTFNSNKNDHTDNNNNIINKNTAGLNDTNSSNFNNNSTSYNINNNILNNNNTMNSNINPNNNNNNNANFNGNDMNNSNTNNLNFNNNNYNATNFNNNMNFNNNNINYINTTNNTMNYDTTNLNYSNNDTNYNINTNPINNNINNNMNNSINDNMNNNMNNNINNNIETENSITNTENMVNVPSSALISSSAALINPVTYRIKRTTTVSFHGKMIHYQLYQAGRPLLHAKVKTLKSNGTVYIGNGAEIHLKNKQFVGAILYGKNFTTFSVHERDEFGEEIMTIMYRQGINGSPRMISIFFPTKHKSLPQKLVNRRATLDESNSWTLDMKGKFTINSIKNCVVTDENDNEFAYVMKVEKGTLGIDAHEDFSELMVFAIGLSSFFCKI